MPELLWQSVPFRLCLALPMNPVRLRSLAAFRPLPLLLSTALLAACGPSAPPQREMPPARVVVDEVAVRDLPLTYEYPARVAGSRVVEVRARVNGVITERAYREGQPVKQGDLLFRIEPDNYKAVYDQAAAQVAIQQAAIQQAQANYNRIKTLVDEGAVSRREFDQAEATLAQARAGLAAAQANRTAAGLNLEYTEVRAPVDGIASKEAVTAGNLVSGAAGAGGDLLTTIVQADPAYVEFSMTEPELLRMRALTRQDGGAELKVRVRSGSSCAGLGRVDFTDSVVNPATGTARARAVFANADGCLVSGQFLAIEVTGLTLPQVIAIPKKGVQFGQAGAMVWVVDGKNVAQPRPVTIQESWNEEWILSGGLEAGERIVVDGIMKVRPGATLAPVTPEEDAAQRAQAAAPKAGG